MSRGKTYKIEHVEQQLGGRSHSRRFVKQMKHRRERQETKRNPDRASEYGRYAGWEY